MELLRGYASDGPSTLNRNAVGSSSAGLAASAYPGIHMNCHSTAKRLRHFLDESKRPQPRCGWALSEPG